MTDYIKNLKQVFKQMIKAEISKESNMKIYKITKVNTDMTYDVELLNTTDKLTNVQTIGLGLGNNKGQILKYEANDLVVVGFLDAGLKPIILGSIYSYISTAVDNIPEVNENEYFVINKAGGSFLLIDADNNIILRTNNGAKLKLSNDGSLKIFNKDNYGIECSSSGAITFRDSGGTTSTTSSPGSWP